MQQRQASAATFGRRALRIILLAAVACLVAAAAFPVVGMRLLKADGTAFEMRGQRLFEFGQWSDVPIQRHFTALGAHYASGSSGNRTYMTLLQPSWLIPLVIAAVVAIKLARLRSRNLAHKRITLGLCPRCGYDLRASPERCPECGLKSDGHPATA